MAVGGGDRPAVHRDGLQIEVAVLAVDDAVVVIDDLDVMRLASREGGVECKALQGGPNRGAPDRFTVHDEIEMRADISGKRRRCGDHDRVWAAAHDRGRRRGEKADGQREVCGAAPIHVARARNGSLPGGPVAFVGAADVHDLTVDGDGLQDKVAVLAVDDGVVVENDLDIVRPAGCERGAETVAAKDSADGGAADRLAIHDEVEVRPDAAGQRRRRRDHDRVRTGAFDGLRNRHAHFYPIWPGRVARSSPIS